MKESTEKFVADMETLYNKALKDFNGQVKDWKYCFMCSRRDNRLDINWNIVENITFHLVKHEIPMHDFLHSLALHKKVTFEDMRNAWWNRSIPYTCLSMEDVVSALEQM